MKLFFFFFKLACCHDPYSHLRRCIPIISASQNSSEMKKTSYQIHNTKCTFTMQWNKERCTTSSSKLLGVVTLHMSDSETYQMWVSKLIKFLFRMFFNLHIYLFILFILVFYIMSLIYYIMYLSVHISHCKDCSIWNSFNCISDSATIILLVHFLFHIPLLPLFFISGPGPTNWARSHGDQWSAGPWTENGWLPEWRAGADCVDILCSCICIVCRLILYFSIIVHGTCNHLPGGAARWIWL